jgi:uncharacterized protein YndB with AHSA1/START domain
MEMEIEKETSALVIKKTITLNAEPAKVWEALTNPDLTKKYMFNCEAISLWKPGSPLLWKGAEDRKVYVKGEILQIAPKKLLQYTTIDPKKENIPSNYTTVTIELSSSDDDHTLLSVTDEGFPETEEGKKRYDASIKGWAQSLEGLKKVVEN